jgi:hypothetical protein
MEITRDVAQSVLLGFLQRVQNVKTPPDLRRSFVVKTALLTLAQKAGGSARFIDVDKFLSNAPTDPVEFARRFAKMLPEIVNVEAVDAVNKLSTEDAPPGRGARIGDLVKKTEPGETGPDASRPPPTPRDLEKEGDDAIDRHQQIQGKPGQDTKTASFDVLRAARIAAGLGQAWKDQPNPQKQPEARSTDAIAAAVKKIAPDALVPAEARGTKDADQYAGADQFARDLAAQIDIALQKGRDSVSMQLGVSFAAVKDRGALIKAVENIIATIRAGFPNNAATVVNIDIKVADKYITRGRVR